MSEKEKGMGGKMREKMYQMASLGPLLVAPFRKDHQSKTTTTNTKFKKKKP